MSEALRKFITGKAKSAQAFDKKFTGQQGLVSLVDTMDSAPPEARDAAMKVLRENSDDLEAAATKLRDMVYGAAKPAPKAGVRGKKDAPAETIEGNLPNNANDKKTLPDPPPPKKGSSARKPATAGKPQTPAAKSKAANATAAPRANAGKPAPSQPAPEEAVPEPGAAEEAAVDDDVTEIGRFVPAASLTGVDVAGSFLPRIVDPRVQLDISAMNPLAGADVPVPTGEPPAIDPKFDQQMPPASPADLGAMDFSWMQPQAYPSKAAQALAGLMDFPTSPSPDATGISASPTMYGPFSDGLFDMNSGTAIEPPADPMLPGTITPNGGFLGMDQAPNPFNAEGGFAAGGYGPTQFNNEGGFMAGDYGPPPRPTMDMSLLSTGAGGPMDMSRMSDPAFQYTPPAETPPKTRPPFYDPNRTMGQWWSEPGIVSRANEFLYQRGMPSSIARAVQPTASVIDKAMKIAAPAGVFAGAAYGGLKGLQALSSGGVTSPGGPPTDEEQAALEARAKRSMGELQQILGGRNPASAPASTPVQ